MKICAKMPNNYEYSLCGDAFDAPQTEDDVEPFKLAETGDVVTCDKCRKIIREVRDSYQRGFKLNDSHS